MDETERPGRVGIVFVDCNTQAVGVDFTDL